MIVGALSFLDVAWGEELFFRGQVASQWRYFSDDAQYKEQFNGAQLSFSFKPEFYYESDKNNHFSFVPFLRIDERDYQRTHADLREAYWLHIEDDWQLLMGINQVFWGVTESRHLVDIINQTDTIENFDGEDKLGQAMFNFSLQKDWGDIDLLVLPGFRQATWSGKRGRLRLPLTVEENETEFEAGNKEHHIDMAARYSNTIDDWDFGLYYFNGTDREARFRVNETGDHFIAQYDQIQQIGTDIQYTHDAWLLKFEGIHQEGRYDTFAAIVSGFEYTFYQVNESAVDVGLLAEYLYDGRDSDFNKAPPTLTENDLFIGTRIAWNDVNDRSVIAGVMIDLDDQSTLLSIEYEQRLDNFWSIEMEGRWFTDIDKKNTLTIFKQDSHILFNLIRYF